MAAHYPDSAYEEAGATLGTAETALGCELVLKVRAPADNELPHMKRGAVLAGMLDPFDADDLQRLAAAGLTAFALEAAPRITRAQSLDVLSSQANLAGYKAVLLAANYYGRLLPMMMTAAGTLKAARVVVLGAGVAGLQAIATARRLGAVVGPRTCVRPPRSRSSRWAPSSSTFRSRPMKSAKSRRVSAATPVPCPRHGWPGRPNWSPSAASRPISSSPPR